MKQLLAFLLIVIPVIASAQKKYEDWLLSEAKPPYHLPHIQKIIQQAKKNVDVENSAMRAATFNSLKFEEKLVYTIWYPEEFQQNCDASPPVKNAETKILSGLAECYPEMGFSQQQYHFLNNNRKKIIGIIKKEAEKTGYVACNYKHALLEMEAYEEIPWIIKMYKNGKRKDGDLLTLLNLMMYQKEYKPFMESSSFKKLYYGYENRYINNNKANEDLIINRATDFLKTNPKVTPREQY